MEYTSIVAWQFSEFWLPGLGIVGASEASEKLFVCLASLLLHEGYITN